MIFARLGDKKQTRWQNMAEIVFSWGVSEIKCIILKENNDNPYEIHNNYIELISNSNVSRAWESYAWVS